MSILLSEKKVDQIASEIVQSLVKESEIYRGMDTTSCMKKIQEAVMNKTHDWGYCLENAAKISPKAIMLALTMLQSF